MLFLRSLNISIIAILRFFLGVPCISHFSGLTIGRFQDPGGIQGILSCDDQCVRRCWYLVLSGGSVFHCLPLLFSLDFRQVW